ncbi:PAS domain-containing protein [Streptomyces colonosanans]|uniref:PAS fold-4 domain-containing protein n=1 Tax=Streptomyces colonosanans TaxID=1428652 RepID=A0A1S2PFY4_9ACTN|nr:PAS domain-containing protein [Streptomyces colonosanans]OIJ92718.1 hypothetical protein BIV24_13335 [Streptomyces colonosanans]
MSMSGDHAGGLSPGALAAAVLDDQGRVLWCSGVAADLLGCSTDAIRGRPVRQLLAGEPGRPDGGACDGAGSAQEVLPATGRARSRHRCGGTVDVTFQAIRMPDGLLVLAAPTRDVTVLARRTEETPGGLTVPKPAARSLPSCAHGRTSTGTGDH